MHLMLILLGQALQQITCGSAPHVIKKTPTLQHLSQAGHLVLEWTHPEQVGTYIGDKGAANAMNKDNRGKTYRRTVGAQHYHLQ